MIGSDKTEDAISLLFNPKTLVTAAVKFLGFYLLAFGIMGVIHILISTIYHAISYISFGTKLLQTDHIDWTGLIGAMKDFVSKEGIGYLVNKFALSPAFDVLMEHIFKILLGLYFCKKGRWIVRLFVKEKSAKIPVKSKTL